LRAFLESPEAQLMTVPAAGRTARLLARESSADAAVAAVAAGSEAARAALLKRLRSRPADELCFKPACDEEKEKGGQA